MDKELKKLLFNMMKRKLFIVCAILSILLCALSSFLGTLFSYGWAYIILDAFVLFAATVVTAIIANMIFNIFAVEVPNLTRKKYINKLLQGSYTRLPHLIARLFYELASPAAIKNYREYIKALEARQKESARTWTPPDACLETIREIRADIDKVTLLISEIKENEILDNIHIISTQIYALTSQLEGGMDAKAVAVASKDLCARARKIIAFYKRNYETVAELKALEAFYGSV